ADAGLQEARDNGRIPVVVGGTALYIRAFLYGLDEMPGRDEALRDRLREQAEEHGSEHLHERLCSFDPEAAKQIHPNDLKRIIRAIEIFEVSGQTKTELTSGNNEIRSAINPFIVGLNREREELRTRIRERVEKMLDRGMIDEVKALNQEWEVSRTLKQAIGYREVQRYLDNEIDRDELVNDIVSNTSEFVRKQMNWFEKFPVDEWFHPDRDHKELIETFESNLERCI
ncbi:MAG: tRNA (adenosine(37)-N6)-dimethylallyltransferase MiaA, partial [bacterium]